MKILTFPPLRLAGSVVWALAVLGFCWIAVDLAVSGFFGTATLLPLGSCGILLLAIYSTLLRPGRRFGKTLALYVIAAAVVAVSVSDDLGAGAPLAAMSGIGGLLLCCWLSAGLLIFARPRKGAPEAPPAEPGLRSASIAGGAAIVAAALILGSALVLPALAGDSSTAADQARLPALNSVSKVQWRSAAGGFVDYPDRLAAAGNGYLVAQSSSVTSFDGSTGAERWHYRVDGARGFQAVPNPDGSMVVVTFRPGAEAAVAGKATRLLALDGTTGKPVWSSWLSGGELTPIRSVTTDEIWLNAPSPESGTFAVQRISIADGTRLSDVTVDPGSVCSGTTIGVGVSADRILAVSDCAGQRQLQGFQGGAAQPWTFDLGSSEQTELLTVGGAFRADGLSSMPSTPSPAVVVVPLASAAAGAGQQITGPSTVLSADGTELFTIPAEQRPIRLLHSAVVTWKAGALLAYPLDGRPAFPLSGLDGCLPDENSALLGLADAVLASCQDDTALGVFNVSGESAAIALDIAGGADLWLTSVPGAVAVYDSVSGITIGLG